MNALGLEQIPNVQIGLLSQIQPDQQIIQGPATTPLPFTYLQYVERYLRKVLGLKFQRTIYCKHRGSCVCSCFASATKAGLLSYLIKCGLSTLFGIKKIIKSPKSIIDGFISKDSIKFGLFICAFLLVFRSIVCFMRRKTQPQNQKYAFLLAGFVSGTLSALILDKKSRQTFGLFLIARAIDITYRSLVEKKIVPDFKYFYPVMYGLMMVITGGIALGTQPAAMSPQLNKFYLLFTNQTPSDQQMRRIWIQRKNIQLAKQGIPPYNVFDYLPKARALYQKQMALKKP